MRIHSTFSAWLLPAALCLVPLDVVAQPEVAGPELARARVLLDLSRAELAADELALLSGRLAEAEAASVELTAAVQASQAVAATAEGGAAAASAEATVTGGRALIGGVAELLPLLLMVWPATAHAPGTKQEPPRVQDARAKLYEKLRALAEAARTGEGKARCHSAASTPRQPTAPASVSSEEAASAGRRRDRGRCWCVCVKPGEMQGGQHVKDQAECQRYCDSSPWGGKGLCK